MSNRETSSSHTLSVSHICTSWSDCPCLVRLCRFLCSCWFAGLSWQLSPSSPSPPRDMSCTILRGLSFFARENFPRFWSFWGVNALTRFGGLLAIDPSKLEADLSNVAFLCWTEPTGRHATNDTSAPVCCPSRLVETETGITTKEWSPKIEKMRCRSLQIAADCSGTH